MKKPIKIILSILTIALVLYIFISLYVSFKVNSVVNDAIGNKAYEYTTIIDEFNYSYLNPNQPECDAEHELVTIESSHTFPLLIPFTNTVYYRYTYLVYDGETNEEIYGSLDSDVLLKVGIKDFKIYIYDVEELLAPLYIELFS